MTISPVNENFYSLVLTAGSIGKALFDVNQIMVKKFLIYSETPIPKAKQLSLRADSQAAWQSHKP